MKKGNNNATRTDGDKATRANANVEPHPCNAPLAAYEATTFVAPVRITFVHTRKRLADIDGLSGKAAIDGLVEAGILESDSPQQVEEVRHRQVKGDNEETLIVIEATSCPTY